MDAELACWLDASCDDRFANWFDHSGSIARNVAYARLFGKNTRENGAQGNRQYNGECLVAPDAIVRTDVVFRGERSARREQSPF